MKLKRRLEGLFGSIWPLVHSLSQGWGGVDLQPEFIKLEWQLSAPAGKALSSLVLLLNTRPLTPFLVHLNLKPLYCQYIIDVVAKPILGSQFLNSFLHVEQFTVNDVFLNNYPFSSLICTNIKGSFYKFSVAVFLLLLQTTRAPLS